MTLWAETRGTGADLVLLHGWGLHSGIWGGIVDDLARRWRVTCIDLPGHGRSPLTEGRDLDAFAGQVAAAAPPCAMWLGWSLGGMVAMRIAAAQPERVERLALVAANPRFVQGDDWPYGVAPEVLAQFSQNLEQDYRGTLLRFLALEAMGGDRSKEELRLLRQGVFERGEPRPEALRTGLEILHDADLRPLLPALRCPTLLIYGERDRLVSRRAGPVVAGTMRDATMHVIRGAAHAPFLSHPDEFLQVLEEFLDSGHGSCHDGRA